MLSGQGDLAPLVFVDRQGPEHRVSVRVARVVVVDHAQNSWVVGFFSNQRNDWPGVQDLGRVEGREGKFVVRRHARVHSRVKDRDWVEHAEEAGEGREVPPFESSGGSRFALDRVEVIGHHAVSRSLEIGGVVEHVVRLFVGVDVDHLDPVVVFHVIRHQGGSGAFPVPGVDGARITRSVFHFEAQVKVRIIHIVHARNALLIVINGNQEQIHILRIGLQRNLHGVHLVFGVGRNHVVGPVLQIVETGRSVGSGLRGLHVLVICVVLAYQNLLVQFFP